MLARKWLVTGVVFASIGLSACTIPSFVSQMFQATPTLPAASASLPVAATEAESQPVVINPGALAAFQGLFEQIYAQVSPSVVAIRVVEAASSGGNPFFGPSSQAPEVGLGSGFVWDTSGDLVTNNHVVDGARSITVIFADGTTAAAKVVGTDPDSDLAVIRVDVPSAMLHPVALADSSAVVVGQVTIAIGNPFGEQNTMTQGIVSALGRQLPVSSSQTEAQGPTYTIPDVIQTDAAINPGNSGGVLLDDQGRVIGVTSAIESPAGSSAGVGFAIPSNIVSRVVPALIKTGRFLHPYLGIGGIDMTSDLASAMGLSPLTRGALVESITPGGPASKAGVRASSRRVTIEGQTVEVGGDVILAVDATAIKSMADLIAYTADNTQVGQTVSLTVLRGGKQTQLSLTLEARPSGSQTASVVSGAAWLGIDAETLNADLAQAMNLPADQQGVLILRVTSGSPAEKAGLRGGSQTVTIAGVSTLIGGDVIVGMDGQAIATSADLQAELAQEAPGQTVRIFFLRSGRQRSVEVSLGTQP
ncbi:MAG: trypsin-like peptidase domain-containing protein [Anaerolineales bacterium]|jgi:2-alkenal reductase